MTELKFDASKPFSFDALKEALEKMLHESALFNAMQIQTILERFDTYFIPWTKDYDVGWIMVAGDHLAPWKYDSNASYATSVNNNWIVVTPADSRIGDVISYMGFDRPWVALDWNWDASRILVGTFEEVGTQLPELCAHIAHLKAHN